MFPATIAPEEEEEEEEEESEFIYAGRPRI